MKQPHVKNPSFGFHGALEMSALVQVAPSSTDFAWKVSISVSLGSLRLSNHITFRLPASSTETCVCSALADPELVEQELVHRVVLEVADALEDRRPGRRGEAETRTRSRCRSFRRHRARPRRALGSPFGSP